MLTHKLQPNRKPNHQFRPSVTSPRSEYSNSSKLRLALSLYLPLLSHCVLVPCTLNFLALLYMLNNV
jgi:hypothetical protein